ncbi:MAG TPA: PilZ domain-containing protein, partial [Myxococcota bacterium]|nr:PilZ domain-containing protein [Myxococcota bacterium]
MDVLVSHDGELADVCQILRELGAAFAERVGPPPVVDLAGRWDLVVATPMRVARLACALARPETRALVVAEPGTRAAGRRLHQIGVDWIANRPVHPAALRLLLQHALYRGPERRHSRRVTVGLPVRYRAGWLPRRALLRELSLRGASVVADRRLAPGRRLTLEIDDDGVRIRVDAEVVRSRAVGPPGRIELGLAFDVGPAAPVVALRRLLDRHARGPATCAAAGPSRGERTRAALASPCGAAPARGEPAVASEEPASTVPG